MIAIKLSVSGLFYRGADLFASVKVDQVDSDDCIVGYSGALLRIVGKEPETVFKSDELGLLAGTALSSGDLAVGTTDSEILVLAPNGTIRRRFPSGLMPSHSPDFVVAGGTPEQLVVGSRAYSNAKSARAEQWDTTSWTQGKSIAFTNLSPLSVGPRGVVRTTGKGYANAASWGVLEYAWKGAPKAVKTPTQRSSWCVATAVGWLVSDSETASFVEPSGAVRWTIDEPHIGARALSDTRLAIVTFNAVVVVDLADGRVVESQPIKVGKTESFESPCPIAASAAGAVAFASQTRLLIVQLGSVDVSKQVAFAVRPGPAATEIAKVGKAAKKVAEDEASASCAAVEALEALTSEIVGTEDVKVLKKARAKVSKLDLLEAADEPKNAKRIAKCEKALRARLKALPLGSPASLEIASILDVMTDS